MSRLRTTLHRSICSGVLGGLLLTLPALAQQIPVPRDPPPAQTDDAAYKVFDAQHLKDVPYNGALPRPIFPSTDRVQRTFTVEYVYDYAYSAYQPAVNVPIVSPLQAKRDTPEDALIALYSAARTGNYEAFVQCYDDAGKAHFAALARDQKQGAAYFQNIWKTYFGTKPILLLDRIETAGYVILDSRFVANTGNTPFPAIFKNVGGKWVATDDLGQRADQMLMGFKPTLAGEIIRVQPKPASQLVFPLLQQAEAQADFLRSHGIRNEMIHGTQ